LSHDTIRLLRRDALFQLLICDDAALFGVDEEHAARLQTPLRRDAFRRDIDERRLPTP
jgi:hypothetical protein